MAKISTIVSSQFPEYIRSEYPLFVTFIEAYYKWLEEYSISDLETIADIDTTPDQFLVNFQKQYDPAGTILNNIDARTLLKNIKQLYISKGSTDSFNFILHTLFNKESEVFLPSTQIFKPSAAKWNRDVSVKFTLASGMLESFGNVKARLDIGATYYDVTIKSIRKVIGSVNVFEAILDLNYRIDIPNGGTLTTSTFVGTLYKDVARKKIVSGGLGFIVGDLYTIEQESGDRLTIKIKSVDNNSSLTAFDIVDYGHGYISDFRYELAPSILTFKQTTTNLSIKLLNGMVETFSTDLDGDVVSRLDDDILFVKNNYIESVHLLDNTYVGEVLGRVTSTTTAVVPTQYKAAIIFELGYLFEYPGYYSTNVGFPDDASYIQDGKYYQQYSYVLKIQEQLSKYETIVRSIAHPAGTAMYGEYQIVAIQELQTNVISILNRLSTLLSELLHTQEEVNVDFRKEILDLFHSSDALIMEITRTPPPDTVSSSEVIGKDFIKNITDTIRTSELLEALAGRQLDDMSSLAEEVINTYNKNTFDTAVPLSEGCVILGDRYTELSGGTYWPCGYVSNETRFIDLTRLKVDLTTAILLVNATDTLKLNG